MCKTQAKKKKPSRICPTKYFSNLKSRDQMNVESASHLLIKKTYCKTRANAKAPCLMSTSNV